MSDPLELSRRKILAAVATVGAAASAGGSVAAVMTDSETFGSEAAAGILDLDADPSWGNAGSTGSTDLGEISGPEGRETVELEITDNPSFLWFRTQCVQCDPAETEIRVRFGLDTDRDGSVDRWLDGFDGTDDGYLSLREARERLGEGILLGDLEPTSSWGLVVDWTTDETLTTDLSATFDFEFYATQTRHVANTDAVRPEWECPGTVCEPTGSSAEISWIAFCSPDAITPADVSIELSDDGRTVVVTDVADGVTIGAVLLKYGQHLDVFSHDGDTSFTSGTASKNHTQERDAYPTTDTDPPRSNGDPCPGNEWIKYDVDDGVWESSVSEPAEIDNNRSSEDVDSERLGAGGFPTAGLGDQRGDR